jgi:hypothetical protein
MSNSYIKISANQQQFSDTLNLVDFVIPEGMVVDLSESKLLVNVVPSITQPTAGLPGDDGRPCAFEVGYQVEDGTAKDLAPPTPAVLVREAFMKGSRVGQIENLRRVDVLRTGLAQYQKDIDEKRSNWKNCLKPVAAGLPARASCNVNYVNTGTTLSTAISSSDISIPLNEVFDVANSEAYSTDKYGQTHIHFRMNFNHLKIVSLNTEENDAVSPALDSGTFGAFSTITATADGTAITSATSSKATNDPEVQFPFYVGQRVVANISLNGGAAVDRFRRIESISYNNTNGLSTINFTDSLGSIDDTQSCVFNHIRPSPSGGLSYTIDNCQLELKLTDESPPDNIQYTTYSTEEDSFSNITTKLKTYQVEPEADNLLIALTNGSIYPRNKFDNYRIRVDNVEMSNNDVNVDDPEHYDNINKLFLNMDIELKDVSERALSHKKDKDKSNDLDQTLALIGTPLPITQNMKNVNIRVSKANTNEIILFKRMVKSI